ncbi:MULTISPECIES: hypothetical protein [unclassified Methanobrevibacter]|uniref:hypothetical protein n=1 Tax=unclassified Methanobrevibacter TaxID=2638681 RepID=UPI0025EB2478|nr:hypothetical protein [Methanobrevibacter sp. UBA188]
MNLEKYSNLVLGVFIFILFGIGVYFAYVAIFNQFEDSTYNAVYASLLMASISIISFLVSIINNNITRKQTEDFNFIQLRFLDAKEGINELLLFLQETYLIYLQLQTLEKSNNPYKYQYLSPRAFLVMQFTNLCGDIILLNKLPITLRYKIEYKFKDMTNKNFKDDYLESYKIIFSVYPPHKSIRNYTSYIEFINEFRTYKYPEQHKLVFRVYYGSKYIKTQDFYNHFKDIFVELCTNSIDELILKDNQDICLIEEDYGYWE